MVDAAHGAPSRPRHLRPWLAALLSFVFPGLGQAYAGQRRLALLLGLPVVLLIGVGVVLASGIGGLRSGLLSSTFLAAVIAVNVGLFGWRVFAIAHAGLRRHFGEPRVRRTSFLATAVLVLATIGMHAWVGVVVVELDDTLGRVFSRSSLATPRESPVAGGGVPNEPRADPVDEPAYRWDGTERINVLLIGTDAHPTRQAVLTDVVMVVSVDPAAGTAALISIPRDTGLVPLPDETIYAGGLFPSKINALALHASLDPATWCPDLVDDAEACGLRTIRRTVELYVGLELHHYALVDMAGFAELIDAVGGLRLCLPGELHDPQFDGTLANRSGGELVLPAGCNHYGGLDALAYARSRKGWIEMPDGTRVEQTDFSRNDRQQQLLLALRDELAGADLIFELPGVLRAIGRSVSTDVPRDQAGDLASLLPLITGPDIERVVFGYPDFVDAPAQPDVNYLLVPRRDAIREEMDRLVGDDELLGWYLGTTAAGPNAAAEADGAVPAP